MQKQTNKKNKKKTKNKQTNKKRYSPIFFFFFLNFTISYWFCHNIHERRLGTNPDPTDVHNSTSFL